MGDLLIALQSELRTLNERDVLISLFLSNKSPVVSKTPYTMQDLVDNANRILEVEVCIKAIKALRKTKKP